MKKILFFIITISFFYGLPVFAQTVSLAPSSVENGFDSDFSLDLNISSVSDLFGVAFDLDFDSSLITFISEEEGAFLSNGCQTSLMTSPNTPGKLIVGLTRLGASCGGVSGSGKLMTFNFKTLQSAGSSNLSFSNNSLCLLSGGECDYITGSWTGASVSVSAPVTDDVETPGVPTNLSAQVISSTKINLSWSAASDNIAVAGYRIYRNGSLIATTANTSYPNTGLIPSTNYTYTVAAYDAAGNISNQSSSVSAATNSESDILPDEGGGDETPSVNSAPVGYLDSADQNHASGWVYDADAGNEAIKVHIYIDNEFKVEIKANLPRPDVVGALNGQVKNASHGFHVSYDLPSLSAGSHTINVYAINEPAGVNPELIGSPKTITVGGPGQGDDSPEDSSPDDGLSLPYPNGSLITSSSDDKIYFIVNNRKRWITNPDVFISYGFASESQVVVDQSVLDQYEFGPDVSQLSLPEGRLIKAKGDFRVYVIKPPYKRHIFNPAVFSMYQHFSWDDIIEVDKDIVDSYITSDIYRASDDPRVYSLEEVDEANGVAVKHHINMTAEQFANKGYRWEQVFIVNPQERDYYQTGNDLIFNN